VLLVTEPTPSGLHDLERVAELCRHFRLRSAAVINKADLNPSCLAAIHAFCHGRTIPVVGHLPFDRAVTDAMVRGEAVTEGAATPFGAQVRQVWAELQSLLEAPSPLISQEHPS
jgi:MinD superfamily P-loop ATPase